MKTDIRDILCLFYYDETSPSCLRWAVNRGYNIEKGQVAGSLSKKENAWSVVIRNGQGKQERFYCHRIIWLLFNASLNFIIDHKNGDRSNNKIDNLREVTVSGNNRNRGIDSRNKTGYTGVTIVTIGGYEYATAYWIDENSNRQQVRFSIKKLGKEVAIFKAIRAREQAIAELNKNGAGYTDRHQLQRSQEKNYEIY